jgi:hypothetical protein
MAQRLLGSAGKSRVRFLNFPAAAAFISRPRAAVNLRFGQSN